MKTRPLICIVLLLVCLRNTVAAEKLPPELPLWGDQEPENLLKHEAEETVRAPSASKGSPSGSNRVFSYVSKPTYSIHRPEKPNGVGIVVCPGGGYRDVWLDREGHDLAIVLKKHGLTSLVLKYRTNSGNNDDRQFTWQQYLPAVEADARQAIRVLRMDAEKLGLNVNKIGIGGFSAGGNLALLATLNSEPKQLTPGVSGAPNFSGLFYPWFRDDYSDLVRRRTTPTSATTPICPIFIMNALDDGVTPAAKCVDFYATLLKAGVNAELHVFSKGSHGFDLGTGRGKSAAIWPTSFVAWMQDRNIISDK